MPEQPGTIAPKTPAAGATGPYTPVPRGPTSREQLEIAWTFPTFVPKSAPVAEGMTSAQQVRRALAAEDAFASLAGEDRRPLLVLRECLVCNGTDDALMKRQEDNERTLVMSRWFHCVKLPPDVLSEDHPYHALFAGEKPEHLFFARWDGSNRRDLTGQQSRAELWDAMQDFLAAEYEDGANASLKALLDLLDRFDRIDSELATARLRLDDLIESGKASAPKVEKLRGKIAELEKEREEAKAESERLSDLELRPTPAAKPSRAR